MITPRIVNCQECASISQLICDIDCTIYELSKKLYNNIIFSLNLHIDYCNILDLLNYKRILEYKLANPTYLCEFGIDRITSRVRILTSGAKCACGNKSPAVPGPTYIFFFGRVGTPDCIGGFKTVLSNATSELYRSTETYSLGTILYYSDKTRILSLLVLDIVEGLLLTTDSNGVIILIENNLEVPC